MVGDILESLCARIEAAGLALGSFQLDGTTNAKQVTYGPVDADALKEKGLMVGIDFATPVGQPLERPPVSAPTVLATNPSLGTVQIEPGLEWASRALYIHLYMRETRADKDRTGYSLSSAYITNEGKLLKALGNRRRDYTLTVAGIPRGFSTRFEGNPFSSEPGVALHSVFQYRVTYPLVDGVVPLEAFMAKRILLVHDLAPATPVDLTAEPLNPPEPGRVTVVE